MLSAESHRDDPRVTITGSQPWMSRSHTAELFARIAHYDGLQVRQRMCCVISCLQGVIDDVIGHAGRQGALDDAVGPAELESPHASCTRGIERDPRHDASACGTYSQYVD